MKLLELSPQTPLITLTDAWTFISISTLVLESPGLVSKIHLELFFTKISHIDPAIDTCCQQASFCFHQAIILAEKVKAWTWSSQLQTLQTWQQKESAQRSSVWGQMCHLEESLPWKAISIQNHYLSDFASNPIISSTDKNLDITDCMMGETEVSVRLQAFIDWSERLWSAKIS